MCVWAFVYGGLNGTDLITRKWIVEGRVYRASQRIVAKVVVEGVSFAGGWGLRLLLRGKGFDRECR